MPSASTSPVTRHFARVSSRSWSGLLAVLAGLRYTAPIWVPSLLLAQVALFGLRPALSERQRLAADRNVLTLRYEQELETRDELDRLLRAYSDPMYIARRERRLHDPAAIRPASSGSH